MNPNSKLPVASLYELVVYSRTTPCPFVSLARRVLEQEAVPHRELFIDQDRQAEQRVLEWTGFLSVPTLIVARTDEDLPYEPPTSLPPGASPRGIDRGPMLTEPSEDQLVAWLQRYGFMTKPLKNSIESGISVHVRK